MRTLGLITTSDQLTFRFIPTFLQRLLWPKLLNLLTAKFKRVVYEEKEPAELNIKIRIARLPFTHEQLNTISADVLEDFCGSIVGQFQQEAVNHLVLPNHIKENKSIYRRVYKEGNFRKFDGKDLFIALIPDVLKKVCKNAGKDLSHISIGIAEQYFTEKSLFIVKMLSSSVKFMTLATKEREDARKHMESICEDTGLAVWVSDDVGNALKEADIIFVLDPFERFLKRAAVNRNAILFNLSDQTHIEQNIRNRVVDHINILAARKLKTALAALGLEADEELTECLVVLGLHETFDKPGIRYYQRLRQAFYNLGCKVNV